MSKDAKFVCAGGPPETVPEKIQERTGHCFPHAHSDAPGLACLSREMKQLRQEGFCRLPFCLTVEAEAMGADINLGDRIHGPRVREYALRNVEDLAAIPLVDFSSGRIRAVLDAAEQLSRSGEVVALDLEGPFTILSALIEPTVLYRALSKKDASLFTCLARIRENIVAYGRQALQHGVTILSYADPMGAQDILGPKLFREHSGKASHAILHQLRAEAHPENHPGVIHVCGKISTALEEAGYCESMLPDQSAYANFGELLDRLSETNETRIVGHGCFHQLHRTKGAGIREIRLTPPERLSF